LRIISGIYRGRRFDPPEGLGVRPTTDKAREALFNLMAARTQLVGASGLDLFAGSGAWGLELLSRGGAKVVSVEKQKPVVRHLQQIRKQWPVPDWEIVQADVSLWLPKQGDSFDLIFLDPPYAAAEKINWLQQLLTGGRLNPGGWLVLEHPQFETYADLPYFEEMRNYSLVGFSLFFRPEGD